MKHLLILAAFIYANSFAMFAQNDSIIVPEWFKNPPQKAGVVYGVGFASQINLETAERIAKLNAKKDLLKKMNNVFTSFISSCDSTHGVNSKITETIIKIRDESSTTLRNVIDLDKKIYTTTDAYICYYLIEHKTDEVANLFKQKIKSDVAIKKELSDKKLLSLLNEIK
jgi:hypothetical protein